MNRHRLVMNAIAVAALLVVGVRPARAASLQKVQQSTWGVSGLPSYVNMYIYVPDKLAPKPPILVASHHCGGSGTSTFNETKSTFVSLADNNGFVMVFPEATGHNCWDVGSAKSLKHDGGGDTHAVAQMVRYALAKYGGDSSRVYAFGTSSGAMMTEALLGVYPDIFVAGVSVAGVACGCWAAQYSGDSGANPQWSGPCAGGNVSKTAQEWGDLVRAMFPGYMGHRPRVQLWHGTADTTINYKNLGESIKEWTNLLGLNETPTASDTAKAGYTHQIWKSACGYVTVETWSQQGAGHDVSWDAASAAGFLGLDKSAGQDPEALACPGAAGSGGATSSAGSSGSSGVGGAGSGGANGSNGAAAIGGGFEAGHGGASSGMSAAVSGGMPTADAGAGLAGAVVSVNSAGSSGMSAHVAGQAAAGVGNTTSTPGTAAATNGALSRGGCSCVIGERGTQPSTNLAALLCGAMGLLVRRWSRSRHQLQRTRCCECAMDMARRAHCPVVAKHRDSARHWTVVAAFILSVAACSNAAGGSLPTMIGAASSARDAGSPSPTGGARAPIADAATTPSITTTMPSGGSGASTEPPTPALMQDAGDRPAHAGAPSMAAAGSGGSPTPADMPAVNDGGVDCPLPTSFKWTSTGPLAEPQGGNIALKDFSITKAKDKFVVYATATTGNGYNGFTMSFGTWAEAATAKQTAIPGMVAPTIFYFTPKDTWVLTYQWGFQFKTSSDPTDPSKWSAAKSLLSGGPSAAIDQTVLCDSEKCYLFFAGDNGNIYRSSLPIGSFPGTFNGYETIMSDAQNNLFEAVQVYTVRGAGTYLMIVEAIGKGGRFFRAFTSTSLSGTFTPLAAASTENAPFAGKSNVTFMGNAWTNDISHGDMVRNDPSETQTIDPCHLQFLYQGFDKTTNAPYNSIPYRPALLTLVEVTRP